MPADKTKTDATLAQIAVDAYLFSTGGAVVSADANGNPLPFLISPPPNMIPAIQNALQDFTKDCFGETSRIVNPDLMRYWMSQCNGVTGVDPQDLRTCAQLKAFVSDGVDASGASTKSTLNDKLISGGSKLNNWRCQTLDQVGTVTEVAERLGKNFQYTSKGAGAKPSTTQYVQLIADVLANDGKPTTSLYDGAVRLNGVWMDGEARLKQVLNNKTTLTDAETEIAEKNQKDKTLTEISRCAYEIQQGRNPQVNGNDLLVPANTVRKSLADMVLGVGDKLFGLTGGGKAGAAKGDMVVDPNVIKAWADGSPQSEIGTSTDLFTRGTNLTDYVGKAMKTIHGGGATELTDRLANAWGEKELRKCETIVQASDVIDYADDLVTRPPALDKTFKGLYGTRDKALASFGNVMNKDPNLKGTSQFEFVFQVQRLAAAGRSVDVLTGTKTLENELDSWVGKGPDEELERERK